MSIPLQRTQSSLLSNNILKGKIAEEIAKMDYQQNGFSITNTGIGSDFKAIKEYENIIYEEYVDVKAGKSRLTKKQISTKNKLMRSGKNYYVYRVSDAFLINYLCEKIKENLQNIISYNKVLQKINNLSEKYDHCFIQDKSQKMMQVQSRELRSK